MRVMDNGVDDMTVDTRQTILVEFGRLTEDQQTFVDLHSLRAAGGDAPTREDGVVVEFWLRPNESAEALFDDIRGWAIGNGLPVRRLIER